jgi:hypothetical protein
MHRAGTLEKPDAEFLAQANTVYSQCTENIPTWNLDSNRVAQLGVLVTNANVAYAANSDTATSNLTTSTNKKTAFAELKHFLSLFIDSLEGNTDVPDAALEIMGIRSRTHHVHEPIPAPTEAPTVSTVRQHDEITVYVARAEHSHPTQSVTTEKYHGFKLRYMIEGESRYSYELSTRLHHTLHFSREDEGKRITLAAAWINPRLQEGPWSGDVSEVIG